MASISASEVGQHCYAVLVILVYLAAVVDFFRFQSVIGPLVDHYRNAIFGGMIFFPLTGAALALAAGAGGKMALEMGQTGLFQFLAAFVLFFAGCIWVRRCPLRETVRQDLIWKKRLGGSTTYRQPWPLVNRLGAGAGLGICLFLGSLGALSAYAQFTGADLGEGFDNPHITSRPIVQVVFLALLAPLIEEITVRWYLLHALLRFFRRWPMRRALAIALSAGFWALGHSFFEPAGLKMAQIFIVGCFLGAFFPRLGLEGSIVAHLTINLLSLLALTAVY